MYLVDTHALLWFFADDPRLPAKIKAIMESSEEVYVSIGSFWEIAIKLAKGKLTLPVTVTELMEDSERLGFLILPIKATHLERLKQLPEIHKDPFDRLYICQAQEERMTILTTDEYIPQYPVATLWGT